MADVDFVIAAVLLLGVISFSVYYITNGQGNLISSAGAAVSEAASETLHVKLFQSGSVLGSADQHWQIRVRMEEVGGYEHTENVQVSVSPSMGGPKAYDMAFNEIQSTYSTTLDFQQSFAAGEVRYANIFYSGDEPSAITATAANVSFASSYSRVDAIEQGSCDTMLATPYETMLNDLGTSKQFRLELDGCNYGPEPPLSNVYVKKVEVLKADAAGYRPLTGRLSVW